MSVAWIRSGGSRLALSSPATSASVMLPPPMKDTRRFSMPRVYVGGAAPSTARAPGDLAPVPAISVEWGRRYPARSVDVFQPGGVIMRAAFFALLLVFGLSATEGAARMEILTEQQKEALAKAERLLVEVIAITDRGSVDPGPIQETVVRRLKEVGYQPVTDQNQPHDVVFRVKCEQRKVWEGTSRSGGDADLPDSPSRVWKGPACQLVYLLDGQKRGWYKEVRTDFQDAAQAAQQAKAEDPGAYAMAKL